MEFPLRVDYLISCKTKIIFLKEYDKNNTNKHFNLVKHEKLLGIFPVNALLSKYLNSCLKYGLNIEYNNAQKFQFC